MTPTPDDLRALVALPGEGDTKIVRRTRVRRECDNCGEPATKRHSFCYINGRRNPASSMYQRDDCTFCSDAEAFACDACEQEVKRVCGPDGMEWGGTFTAGNRFAGMFLRWDEKEDDSLAAADRDAGELREAVERLTRERDEARNDRDRLDRELDATVSGRNTLRERVETVTRERDGLREALASAKDHLKSALILHKCDDEFIAAQFALIDHALATHTTGAPE